MTIALKQKREAYKRLTPEVRDFIMSNETNRIIDIYLNEVGLSEEQMISADGEILWVMLNLQTLSDAITNIAKLTGKSELDLSDLKNNLQSNIFDKIQSGPINSGEKGEIDVEKVLKNEKISSEQIKNLPENKRKFILGGVWKERTDEIASKYSLSESQTENLVNSVLLVLIGLEKPENFLESIIAELGISRLLAEQIMEDLEVRVFEYAVKSMEKTLKQADYSSFGQDKEKEQLVTLPEVKPVILPEIEPNILPMVEKGETAHDVKPERPALEIKTTPPIQNQNAETKPEPVQQPVSVPRFTAAPMSDTPKPPQPNTPEKKYAVDPYREPLE